MTRHSGIPLVTLLAWLPFLASCGDLGLEPDRIPGSLILEPVDTLVTEGDLAQMRVTVLDQDGEPFPGVPSWASPAWSYSVDGPIRVTPRGQLEALGGGEIRLEAAVAGLKAWSDVRVNPSETRLTAPVAYMIQATQNLRGDVPLVAGRKALLRVFVTSDPGSFYQPTGRASFYQDDKEVYRTPLLPGSYLIPPDVDESRIDRSFNAVVPGSVLQPGVEMVLELDVNAVVPLSPGSQLRIPDAGRTSLDVRALPRMGLTVVPTLLASSTNQQIFLWTNGLSPTSAALGFARSVLPIGDIDVDIRETFTTSADLTTAEGWQQYLREVALLRTTDGSSSYYYGTVTLPSGSKYGGLGYVGGPASVGAPRDRTLAHELGHNMSLRHAPCGGVASWDADYPHDGGFIGVWGYNFEGGSGLGALMEPDQFKDFMGYCAPRWVSDYHFKRALEFRAANEPFNPTVAPPEPVLLVWGSAGGGALVLEPAFPFDGNPVLPESDGPYRIEGRNALGAILFSFGFEPERDSRGGGHFTFAVPVGPGGLGALSTISLRGPEGTVALDRSLPSTPVALVRAPGGRVSGILRGVQATPPVRSDDAAWVVSRGVPDGGVGR